MSDEIILDKRISFITEDKKYNDAGFPVRNGETEYYKCWANIKRLSFKEFYSSKTDNSKIIDSFRVRRCKKVDFIDSRSYKIKYNNNTYNIIYINPINDDFIDFKGELINE